MCTVFSFNSRLEQWSVLSTVVLLSTETHSFYVLLLYCHINSEIILYILSFLAFYMIAAPCFSSRSACPFFSPFFWCLYSCIFFFYSFYPLGKTPGGRERGGGGVLLGEGDQSTVVGQSSSYSVYDVLIFLILYMFLPYLVLLLHLHYYTPLVFFFFFLKDFYCLLVYHHNDYIVYSLQIFSSLWDWGLGKLRFLKSGHGKVSVMREHFHPQRMRHHFIRN